MLQRLKEFSTSTYSRIDNFAAGWFHIPPGEAYRGRFVLLCRARQILPTESELSAVHIISLLSNHFGFPSFARGWFVPQSGHQSCL